MTQRMSRRDPNRPRWIEGRAAFSLVDQSLKACSDVEGDDCPVPWDYCCETEKLIHDIENGHRWHGEDGSDPKKSAGRSFWVRSGRNLRQR
jgi:hypothetical protein